jgi:hypothetical protein
VHPASDGAMHVTSKEDPHPPDNCPHQSRPRVRLLQTPRHPSPRVIRHCDRLAVVGWRQALEGTTIQTRYQTRGVGHGCDSGLTRESLAHRSASRRSGTVITRARAVGSGGRVASRAPAVLRAQKGLKGFYHSNRSPLSGQINVLRRKPIRESTLGVSSFPCRYRMDDAWMTVNDVL